jgi:hypothetical protein
VLQEEWVFRPFVRRLLESQAVRDRRNVQQEVERQNGLQPVQDRGKHAPRLLPGELDQRTGSAATVSRGTGCEIVVNLGDMLRENVTLAKSFRARKAAEAAMNRCVGAMKPET